MMQILLFGDALSFFDFIFKGTLITKTPHGRSTLTRTGVTRLYSVFGLGLGEQKTEMLDIQKMIEALMPVFNWTGLWMVSSQLFTTLLID